MESGVKVATTMWVSSPGSMPASSRATREALSAMSDAASSSATMWRCLLPVRVVIHSSVVSTIFSRSALVRTRSGA